MEYLFLILLVMGFFHFLWEGILAPSFRFDLRYRLFECRDELRLLKINNPNIPDWTFNHMQDFINTAIERMHRIDIVTINDAKNEIKNNEHLRNSISKTAKRLDDEIKEADCKELIELRSKVYLLFAAAFGINAGGGLIYYFPILIMISTIKDVKNLIKNLIKDFLYMPVGIVEKISPEKHRI